MELRQLQHFVAVAEEQHFTRAAQRVNIVQSALSTSIRALEDELGAQLFVRSTRQVRLTRAGQEFLTRARIALDAVREAREAVGAIQGLTRGTLGIGTVQSLPAFLNLPSLIADFHGQHPGVDVRLSQGGAAELLEKVKNGQLDLAFLPICEPPAGLAATMIACEALVMVCAPGHPLAGQEEVPVAALKDEPFADFAADWGTRRLVDHAFLEARVERHTAFEVSDLETLLDLVGRRLAIALIPEAIAEARRSSLGIVRLAGTELCWELVVAYAVGEETGHTPADHAARAFLDLMNGATEAGAAAAE